MLCLLLFVVCRVIVVVVEFFVCVLLDCCVLCVVS